jgi:hypothetical protein
MSLVLRNGVLRPNESPHLRQAALAISSAQAGLRRHPCQFVSPTRSTLLCCQSRSSAPGDTSVGIQQIMTMAKQKRTWVSSRGGPEPQASRGRNCRCNPGSEKVIHGSTE